MPPAPQGDLPTDVNLQGELTIRKGDILENPRGGSRHTFQFTISEGYVVVKAKVSNFTNMRGQEVKVYFKRSKSAVQSQFVELTTASFEDHLKHRWSRISAGDLQKWNDERKTPAEGMKFEFFVYTPKETRRAAGIRRATANRIREAAERIRQFEGDNPNIRIGDIQRNHLQIYHARQQEGTAITIPQDNTNRQAAALDEAMRELENENNHLEQQRNSNLRSIRIELQGTMLDVRVDIASLRTALSLPQHDLFHQGIYRQYQHPDLGAEDDCEDDDHADPVAPNADE